MNVVILKAAMGNIRNNHANQLRRIVGMSFTVIYCGGTTGGTVRDESGKFWDWWPTEEVLEGGFTRIRVVSAK